MRKKCFSCNRYTYTEDDIDDLEIFCVYCGENLTGEPLLPLGNFKAFNEVYYAKRTPVHANNDWVAGDD